MLKYTSNGAHRASLQWFVANCDEGTVVSGDGRRLVFYLVLLAALGPLRAFAQSAVNYVPLGGEAAGMGGAYTGISSDPTAAIYNPAGLAFTTSKSISSSFTSYSTLSTKIPHLVTGTDYKRTQSASPFFTGSSYQGPQIAPSWTFGVAFYDSWASSSKLHWSATGQDTLQFPGQGKPQSFTAEFLDVDKIDESDLHLAGVAARAFGPLAIGFEFGAVRTTYTEEFYNQDHSGPIDWSSFGAKTPVYLDYIEHADTDGAGTGAQSGLGVLLRATPTLTLGAAVTTKVYLSQSSTFADDFSSATTDADGNQVSTTTDGKTAPVPISRGSSIETDHHPFASTTTLRTGVAVAATETTQVDVDTIIVGPSPASQLQERQHATADLAVGMQSRVAAKYVLSLGAYTKFDGQRAESVHGLDHSGDFLDLYSGTTALTYKFESFDVILGGMFHDGVGHLRSRNPDNSNSQSISYHAQGYTFALSIASR